MKSTVIIGIAFGIFVAIAIAVTLMMEDPRTVSSAVEAGNTVTTTGKAQGIDLSVQAKSSPTQPKSVKPVENASDSDSADADKTIEYKGYQFNADAIASLRDTRLNGDARAPKIGKHIEEEQATQEEIDDPDLYQAYEARQDKKLFRAYVVAAKDKIKMLEKEIKYAREQGMPEEQLQEGIQKLQGIKDMRDKLLQEHPDLINESTQSDASAGQGASNNTPAP